MRRPPSSVVAGALMIIVVMVGAGYVFQTKYGFLTTDFLASVLPGVLAALTNQDRAAEGLAGVTEDPVLDAAAQAAAEDMASKGYFSHVSPSGKTPWYWLDQAGYRYSYAGQNLAVDFSDSKDVETAWMESPTHRANITKREYTHVGFGTANGVYEGRETTFVVEFFATPAAESEVAPAVTEVRLPSSDDVSLTSVTVPQEADVLGSQTEAVVPALSRFLMFLNAVLSFRF